MKKPTWLDTAIQAVIDQGDPVAIAQVVANTPEFMNAIKRGLANKPKPGVMGPSYAQIVADEIKAALAVA